MLFFNNATSGAYDGLGLVFFFTKVDPVHQHAFIDALRDRALPLSTRSLMISSPLRILFIAWGPYRTSGASDTIFMNFSVRGLSR
jgi:hypothetical protein